jgi:FlaA1/EpsC-like NDP-sugar epimerase
MRKKYDIQFVLGDIRDCTRLLYAVRNVDVVIHAAALKHVESGEISPQEVIKTNVYGTQNVVNAIINSSVRTGVFVSSDKAVEPINLYGATKLIGEKIFLATGTEFFKKFMVVRSGNFYGSRGSVVEWFRLLKSQGAKEFPVTDSRMSRYFIDVDTFAKIILHVICNREDGDICIPKMESVNIATLARSIDPNAALVEVGMKPGEKLHESLWSPYENPIEEKDYYVIAKKAV